MKNIIMCGPPGTGKTFKAISKALEVINNKKYSSLINNYTKREDLMKEYKNLLDENRVVFCTFHQSFSYEDFVEGLRSDDSGKFVPKDGIFKRICESAELEENKLISGYEFNEEIVNFHKMSLGDTKGNDEEIYEFCIGNNCIALGWGGEINYKSCKDRTEIKKRYSELNPNSTDNNFNITAINRFKNGIKKGDIVLISEGNYKIRAVAKVTGDYRYDSDTEIRYNHFRAVEWLYKGESIGVEQFLIDKMISQQAIYMFAKNDLNIENIKRLLSGKEARKNPEKFVIIIDEINRGNISKIFGELITLIEEDKRKGELNEITVTLPYSKKKFSVPSNIYIIGTMNTADRSISLFDTALRRRFQFIDYYPVPNVLPKDVDGIDVSEFLRVINERIEFLYDKDHLIGHAYFIKDSLNYNDLVTIVKYNIIPLLQEYFYGDWEKIEAVLGGAGVPGDSNYFLNKEVKDPNSIFGNHFGRDFEKQCYYTIVNQPHKEAFYNVYQFENRH
ncbi:AAA family ATPase [Priestia aryabhattai]|uniref:AAA family ATPase n=1 Tax=Priestia aryabhattai TaxID=412384 RepID=UPI003D7FB8C2